MYIYIYTYLSLRNSKLLHANKIHKIQLQVAQTAVKYMVCNNSFRTMLILENPIIRLIDILF